MISPLFFAIAMIALPPAADAFERYFRLIIRAIDFSPILPRRRYSLVSAPPLMLLAYAAAITRC